MHTQLRFLNHASVLIQYDHHYLLTDPWHESPAFGSWLPIPPLYVHPAYLAALKSKLRILVSHGHDDHCDDRFLSIFDPSTPVISSDYESPGLKRRLEKLGLRNLVTANREGIQHGPFYIRSFRDESVSLDDAIYLIRTPDAVIVHSNDFWCPLPPEVLSALQEEASSVGSTRCIYMSQTNSASGYPQSYREFSAEEKQALQKEKVHDMIQTGMKNASNMGCKYFLSYAGFAGVFVKGHEEYLHDALYPSGAYIQKNLKASTPRGLEVLDLRVGDTFDFKTVSRAFGNEDIDEEAVREAAARYYQKYGIVNRCDSFLPSTFVSKQELQNKLSTFLDSFSSFVLRKVTNSGFEPTALGKILTIEVSDMDVCMSVKFGEGVVPNEAFDKKIIVESSILMRVLRGESLLENLYTGYNAEIERKSAKVYNRDIVMYLVMFSYVYKNAQAALAQTVVKTSPGA